MMENIFRFVSKCSDGEVAKGIAPIPGLMDTLKTLALEYMDDGDRDVACGLVTGNVEGIARRKMQALGIHGTNAFTSLF